MSLSVYECSWSGSTVWSLLESDSWRHCCCWRPLRIFRRCWVHRVTNTIRGKWVHRRTCSWSVNIDWLFKRRFGHWQRTVLDNAREHFIYKEARVLQLEWLRLYLYRGGRSTGIVCHQRWTATSFFTPQTTVGDPWTCGAFSKYIVFVFANDRERSVTLVSERTVCRKRSRGTFSSSLCVWTFCSTRTLVRVFWKLVCPI